jgi:fluoride exporter
MGVAGWVGLALGGAAGTLVRYLLGGWLARVTGGGFPWETCVINGTGCLAIGMVAAYADRGGLLSAALRVSLMAGLLGGFTTFSSFGLESFRLLVDAQWSRAALYILLNNAGGLVAVWAGYRAVQLLG